MATHKGSEGTVKVGSNAVAEIRSYSIEESADTLEDTSICNILPLDLDTLVVLSNQASSLKNLEELSNIFSPIKYTFGMNFNNNEHLSKLISFKKFLKFSLTVFSLFLLS